jgi:hypothetical protein
MLLQFLLRVHFGDIAQVLVVFDVAVGLHVGHVDTVVGVEGRERKRAHDAQAWKCVVIVVIIKARSVTVARTRAGHAAELY